jgi:hypothetical protein
MKSVLSEWSEKRVLYGMGVEPELINLVVRTRKIGERCRQC